MNKTIKYIVRILCSVILITGYLLCKRGWGEEYPFIPSDGQANVMSAKAAKETTLNGPHSAAVNKELYVIDLEIRNAVAHGQFYTEIDFTGVDSDVETFIISYLQAKGYNVRFPHHYYHHNHPDSHRSVCTIDWSPNE